MRKLLYILLPVMAALSSCKMVETVAVPVERVRTEFVHDTISRTDSVWIDRYHNTYTKGDTVYIHDSIFAGEYRDIDTKVESGRTDSVPVIQYVDRPVPEEHGFLWKSGVALWIFIALAFFSAIIIMAIKFAK